MAPDPTLPASLRRSLRDALVVAVVTTLAALAANAARPNGLPLVASRPYEILVPCPEKQGEVTSLGPADPRLSQAGAVLVDARSAEEFRAWHAPGARHVPYDYLEPVGKPAIEALLSSGASLVAVYGDGADPDSGRELARELAGSGLRNVYFVEGGAPALRGGAR